MGDLATVITTDPTPGQVTFTAYLVVALALIVAIEGLTVLVLVTAKRRARTRVFTPADIPTETLEEVA
jgi:hypothetical protein